MLVSWQLLVSPAPRDLTPLVSMIGSTCTHTQGHMKHSCTHAHTWVYGDIHTHMYMYRHKQTSHCISMIPVLRSKFSALPPTVCPWCTSRWKSCCAWSSGLWSKSQGLSLYCTGLISRISVPQNTVWKPLVWIILLKKFTPFWSLNKYIVIPKVSKT